jgi:hypothetical protein
MLVQGNNAEANKKPQTQNQNNSIKSIEEPLFDIVSMHNIFPVMEDFNTDGVDGLSLDEINGVINHSNIKEIEVMLDGDINWNSTRMTLKIGDKKYQVSYSRASDTDWNSIKSEDGSKADKNIIKLVRRHANQIVDIAARMVNGENVPNNKVPTDKGPANPLVSKNLSNMFLRLKLEIERGNKHVDPNGDKNLTLFEISCEN